MNVYGFSTLSRLIFYCALEISIDANIPLPSDCDTIAILGLFRSIEKIEFSQRDLEIVKLLQPHLSERMKTDICNGKCIGNGNCGGVGKCKEAAEISQPASGDWELNNIDTLGICACDINGNIISSNSSFSNFSIEYDDENSQNPMIDAMKKEFETNFKEAYEAGKLYLMAASSSTAEVTEEWIRQIKESFPGMDVMCDNLSLGLSCHIGPDGLGIACCNKAE